MNKTLDGCFVVKEEKIILKRKGVCQGGRHSGTDYIEPFIAHSPTSISVFIDKGVESKVPIGPSNKDVFYAAKMAGYLEGELFEYEIIIPIKK